MSENLAMVEAYDEEVAEAIHILSSEPDIGSEFHQCLRCGGGLHTPQEVMNSECDDCREENDE